MTANAVLVPDESSRPPAANGMEMRMSDVLLLGLSGGIDSSAAALLARERWPSLPAFAVHQNLGWDDPAAEEDAIRVAEMVGAELTIQRTEVADVWRERKFIPMAGMPCPASLELKAEPGLMWAAETLGGRARWLGSKKSRKQRAFDVVEMPKHDGLYVLGFLAGEEGRAARYRGSWPVELGRPVFPLMEAGMNKDDARAVLRRHGLRIDYGGLPRRSCQPCIHWTPRERQALVRLRPEHAKAVADVEREIGRTFDRRGPFDALPSAPEPQGEQPSFAFVDGSCGAWCR